MISGTTRPATSRGMPKISPRLVPPPNVRLTTNPAMKRIKPMAMAKEKLESLSNVFPDFVAAGCSVLILVVLHCGFYRLLVSTGKWLLSLRAVREGFGQLLLASGLLLACSILVNAFRPARGSSPTVREGV